MTSDNNCHPDYVSPGSFTPSVIDLLSFMVEQNEAVVIPEVLVDVYGEFAKKWEYDWASVKEYVERLEEWIVCGPECFAGAVCLMKRLEKLGTIPPVTQKTVHRVYLACLVLTVKVFEDETLNNADFAKVGCVTLSELNKMEEHLCKALQFNLTFSEQDYEDTISDLKAFESTPRKRRTRNFIPRHSPSEPVGLEGLFEVVRELNGKQRRKSSFSQRTTEFLGSVRKSANLRIVRNSADIMPAPVKGGKDKVAPVFIIRQDSC